MDSLQHVNDWGRRSLDDHQPHTKTHSISQMICHYDWRVCVVALNWGNILLSNHHTTVVTWPQSAFLGRSLLTAGYCFCTREVENAQSSTLNGVKNVSWPLRIHWSQTINFHFHVNILTCFREMAWLTEAFGLCSAIRDVTWWVVQCVGPIFCTVVQATKVQVYSSCRYHPPHPSSFYYFLFPLLDSNFNYKKKLHVFEQSKSYNIITCDMQFAILYKLLVRFTFLPW